MGAESVTIQDPRADDLPNRRAAHAVRPSTRLPYDALRLSLGLAAKRALDLVFSTILLLVLLPVLVVLAVLVRMDSPGPSFFRCERVGHRGQRLRMLKFRKMVTGAAGAPLTNADDERFTRMGLRLAKYKLDELPQLWHVLKGEMSLVGPRPEDPGFVERYAEDFHGEILHVKPGMVGLSQLAFADETGVLNPAEPLNHYIDVLLPQKIALDRMYAANVGPRLDLKILYWTFVAVVLRKPVAVHRDTGHMNLRRR